MRYATLGFAVSRRWRGGCKPISTGGLVKNNHGVSPRAIVLPAMDLRKNDGTEVRGYYRAPLWGEIATQTTLADDKHPIRYAQG